MSGFQGKKNVYVCEGKYDLEKLRLDPGSRHSRVGACGRRRVTVDRDFGVTPMFITCDCGGDMCSSMYRVDQTLEPSHEWYAPIITKEMSPGVRHHVDRGGLLLREIDPRRPQTNVTSLVSRQTRRAFEREQRKRPKT